MSGVCCSLVTNDGNTYFWGNNQFGQYGNGVFSTATDFVTTPTQISNCTLAVSEFSNVDISLFPNPTNNILNIDNSQTDELIKNVKVTDLNGRVVFEKKEDCNTLDVTELQNGVYILTIELEHRIVQKKFIKI